MTKVALVGNPNVGKSVIFGLLTGQYVTVSNYPGTTVEVARGRVKLPAAEVELIDTPGVNNLIPLSEDEAVTRDILLKEDIAQVIQVADAKNLRRAILIAIQLSEIGLPFVLDLNMEDEALSAGIRINKDLLSKTLNVPVLATVAIEKKGIRALVNSLGTLAYANVQITYEPMIEKAVSRIMPDLPRTRFSNRAIALMLICGDAGLKNHIFALIPQDKQSSIESVISETARCYMKPLSYVITQTRLNKADELLKYILSKDITTGTRWVQTVSNITTHPVWGIPILLIVLYLMYLFVGKFGAGTLVGFFEQTLFGEYINPFVRGLADRYIHIHIIRDFLVGDYGLITMALAYGFAIILPIVGMFFLAFGFLEDSGYLPRLSILVNRLFKIIGLNGKAVLPIILGLGCDTMATMTTRILTTPKERIITIFLLALAIPCSAQLGVILGIVGKVGFTAFLWWFCVVLVTFFVSGWLASKVVPGTTSDFITEIPPLRRPSLRNIGLKTYARVYWYLKEVIPIFILGTAMLFVLDRLGLLMVIQRVTEPVIVQWLGLPAKATEAFLIGFFRRDYGAAGLYDLFNRGLLNDRQVIVSIITITLFVPCMANFLMMVKERGWKSALLMIAIIFPIAFGVGGLVNLLL